MPKLIPQTFFFGAPSVIYARINSPKQFFPACIGSVDDGRKPDAPKTSKKDKRVHGAFLYVFPFFDG